MSWASQVYRLSRKLDKPSAWALAFVLFAASVAARVLLEHWVEPLKFLTFYPAIAASTLLCGWLQGTVVLILSALVAWYFFFEPVGSFAVRGSQQDRSDCWFPSGRRISGPLDRRPG